MASSQVVPDQRRSNISLEEITSIMRDTTIQPTMPRKSGRRKAIFAKSIDVAHDVEGQSEVVKEALARRARFSFQKERKPKFYWENSKYIDNMEKFKDLSLQRELNTTSHMSDSQSAEGSGRAFLPTLKRFEGARANRDEEQDEQEQQHKSRRKEIDKQVLLIQNKYLTIEINPCLASDLKKLSALEMDVKYLVAQIKHNVYNPQEMMKQSIEARQKNFLQVMVKYATA